jgi:hypothetical protein
VSLERIVLTFKPDGTTEISVTYTYPADADDAALANPGTKKRTATAARMAAHGLRLALEGLEEGSPVWGGFATDMRRSKDMIMVDRKESAA